MDFSFEDLPSTSAPNEGYGDLPMMGDVTRGPSTVTSEIEDQQSSSRIEDICKRAQQLVSKMNEGRASDQKVIDSFQEKLMEKVSELCQQMKENMFSVYEENNDEVRAKLQELSEVLDSCSKLHQELLEATQALGGLREALSLTEG